MALRHGYFILMAVLSLLALVYEPCFQHETCFFFLNMCLQIADFCVCVGKMHYREIAAHFKKTVRPPKTRESRREYRDHGFFRALHSIHPRWYISIADIIIHGVMFILRRI